MKDTYSVTQFTINYILEQIRSKQIAIPEIQRPFVWNNKKVRDLIDSLYNGYPTGYLITWKNPSIKIKGGGTSEGKTVLIDGQQRVTALMAALAGEQVLNDEYKRIRIKIAYNPMQENEEESPFAVLTPAFEKSPIWISDISELFTPDFDSFNFVMEYKKLNPESDTKIINSKINNLRDLLNRQIGVITINQDCTVDEVTEIFIRINSKGAELSQADFAMSKIAADEEHGGSMLRKAIDYYSHLAYKPEFWDVLADNDKEFMNSEYAKYAEWLKDDYDDIYDPDYTDILRVAFMHEFGRGKLANLVSLLSGRDFDERDYKSEIADESFKKLKAGVIKFMDKNNFKDFILAIRSAGFISSKMMFSKNALNFAYTLYLLLRENKSIAITDVKRYVQRWYVMSVLTGRYSGSPESVMDRDMRQITELGFLKYYNEIVSANMSDAFWNAELPQKLRTTSTRAGAWAVYMASFVKFSQNTLFSTSFKYKDIIDTMGDVHHIFPKAYLKETLNATKGKYNQLANFTHLEKYINIIIGKDTPCKYFSEVKNACINGEEHFGNIKTYDELLDNMRDNCIPESIFDMDASNYEEFLEQRRILMSNKIKDYFFSL